MDVTGQWKTVLVKLFLMALAMQMMFAKAVQEHVDENPETNQLSRDPISTTEYDEDLRRDVSTTEYDEDLRKAVQKYLLNEDHRQLRQMLKLAVKMLEREGFNLNENERSTEEYVTSSEMPFYFDHIWSIVNGDVKKSSRRRHQKRSSFDSIAHQGGLSGFGNTHRRQKMEFTFENLLPFLIEEMRRNNREIGGRNY